jgi:hypothetical protein
MVCVHTTGEAAKEPAGQGFRAGRPVVAPIVHVLPGTEWTGNGPGTTREATPARRRKEWMLHRPVAHEVQVPRVDAGCAWSL